MPVRHSAALLVYRLGAPGDGHTSGPSGAPARAALAVFLGHMGGPFWARRDQGAWSIPKGEYDPSDETPEDVARREFREEIGIPAPEGELLDLGVHAQPSGKRIRAFAVAAPVEGEIRYVGSNEFTLEWPRGSGSIQSYPEIDRAGWFPLDEARRQVVSGQVPILDALALALVPPSRPAGP